MGWPVICSWAAMAVCAIVSSSACVRFSSRTIGMFMTPNQARRAEGWPDDPDGDKLYQPTNMAPLGFEPAARATTGPGSDLTGQPAPGGDGDPSAPPVDPDTETDD